MRLLLFVFFFRHPIETWLQKHFLSTILHRMALVCRFGSCLYSKSCQNRKGRNWKCQSVVMEWSLESWIKTQGEDNDWTRETVARSQAGVDPMYACTKPTFALNCICSQSLVCVHVDRRWTASQMRLLIPSYLSLTSQPSWGFYYLRNPVITSATLQG